MALDEMELRALRAEIGLANGLTLAQAKRLVGDSRAELEAYVAQLRNDLGFDKRGEDDRSHRRGPAILHPRAGPRPSAGRSHHREGRSVPTGPR